MGKKKIAPAMALIEKPKRGRPRVKTATFSDLIPAVLESQRLRGLSELGIQKDLGRLRIVGEMLAGVPLRKVTVGVCERVLERLARGDRGGKPRIGETLNRYRSTMAILFKYAVRQGYLDTSPFAGKVLPWSKRSGVHVRFLRDELQEEQRLVDAILAADPGAVGEMRVLEMRLTLATGMRRSEQFRARWDNWNQAARTLSVTGKTGKSEVLLGPVAMKCLEEMRQRAPVGNVYITPERNESAIDSRRWFERAVKAAGLSPKFHWRDLRHACASRAAMENVPLLTIQQMLRHKSFAMTLKYAHLSPGHVREAVDKVG